ncbi:MAG TPA: FAD-binding oxidoreductase, partial [Candidatus Saccharimonadales bacterium]|nr:FAD-binding oxidoreductase [Candidatus Saccharimonadales bacterium]
MSKVAHYLQEHLRGEVMTSTDARRYFATDGSILQLAPALVAYPRTENDVRKSCRFSWQLAERGRIIPVTPRGAGTDETGAALGSGIMLVFPAHMNRVLELDTKSNTVTVEPGIIYAKLQQTLHTHGRFLPPYPASVEYSTVGGAIANNASGEKSVKYGDTAAYVKSLRMVLANGEVIETGRLNKRDLSKKMGLATFEGEIYRSVDTLLEEQHGLLQELSRDVTKNNAGYNLLDVKHKDGSFDLTPLIVGSQGTLGIITEAVLKTEAHNPQTIVMLAAFDSLEQTQEAVLELKNLSDTPSAIELINGETLEQVHKLNPNQLKDIIKPPFPAVALVVEFDNNERTAKKLAKHAAKIFETYATGFDIAEEPEQQQQFWKLRQAASLLIAHNQGQQRAAPVIDDAAVPVERLREYIDGITSL